MKKIIYFGLSVCIIAFPVSVVNKNLSGAIASISAITGHCYFLKRTNESEELDDYLDELLDAYYPAKQDNAMLSIEIDSLEAKFNEMWKEEEMQ